MHRQIRRYIDDYQGVVPAARQVQGLHEGTPIRVQTIRPPAQVLVLVRTERDRDKAGRNYQLIA